MKTKQIPQTQKNRQARDSFWEVVEDCLVEIHQLPRVDAHARRNTLRTRLEQPPPGISSEIVYHAEPFDVACNIAGKQLDLSQYWSQYEPILNRHNW